MRMSLKVYTLEVSVRHLEWLYYCYGWNQMSHPELCEFIYKVYTEQLEPLRLEYRAGRVTECTHELLTRGYKYAREVCRDHDVEWPPKPIDNINERIEDIENNCAKIESDFQCLNRRIEALKSDIRLLKRWSKHLN